MNSIFLKSIKNIFVFTITVNLILVAESNNQKIDEYLTRIERLLEHLPAEIIHQERILHGKRLIIRDILEVIERKDSQQKAQEGKKENDPEACFYEPKQPKKLTEEEKKEDIKKRIEKKYIGKLPGQIEDIIGYYANIKAWDNRKVHLPNRALLHGSPGNGKTYLVETLSNELEIPLLLFSASFFADKYIGEASRKIRKAFDVAKKHNGPIFIFIDEIDAIAKARTDTMHNEYRSTLITLLIELENIKEDKSIFVFVATNNIDALDAAIKDRFAGAIMSIDYLDKEERAKLFKKLYLDEGVELSDAFFQRLAEITETRVDFHFSNRDIKNIVDRSLHKFDLVFNRFPEKFNKTISEKELCKYIREAMDQAGYKGRFAYWTGQKYCDGI